jgi:hypothetical protein
MIANGIPWSIFTKGEALLQSQEGMGSGSIQLFGTLGGALILLSFGKSNVISDVLRYPVQLLFFFFCILSIFWAPNFVFSLRMLAKLLSPFIFLLIAHLMIVDNINTLP